MKRFVQLTIALLMGWLILNVPFAFGQSLSYPDEAGYEDLRRTEMETLDTLAQDHSQSWRGPLMGRGSTLYGSTESGS